MAAGRGVKDGKCFFFISPPASLFPYLWLDVDLDFDLNVYSTGSLALADDKGGVSVLDLATQTLVKRTTFLVPRLSKSTGHPIAAVAAGPAPPGQQQDDSTSSLPSELVELQQISSLCLTSSFARTRDGGNGDDGGDGDDDGATGASSSRSAEKRPYLTLSLSLSISLCSPYRLHSTQDGLPNRCLWWVRARARSGTWIWSPVKRVRLAKKRPILT